MKIIIFLLFLLLSLSSCKKNDEIDVTQSIDSIIEAFEEEKKKEEDKPIQNDKPQYDFNNSNEIISLFLEKYYSLNYLYIECSGQTKASAIITYTQEIENILILDNNNTYYKAVSNSSLVNQYHEAKFSNNNVLYKNKEKDDFTQTTLSNYIEIYGLTPFTVGIVGYDLTKDNVLNISLIQSKDNIYAYEIDIDPNYDFIEVKKQMKEFGELKDYPKFDSIKMTIIMDNELNPLKVILESAYHINKSFLLNNVSCSQYVTYTYRKNS